MPEPTDVKDLLELYQHMFGAVMLAIGFAAGLVAGGVLGVVWARRTIVVIVYEAVEELNRQARRIRQQQGRAQAPMNKEFQPQGKRRLRDADE